MPCYDSGEPWGDAEVGHSGENKRLRREIKTLAAMLCALLNEVDSPTVRKAEANGQVAIGEWWKEHQSMDQKRVEKTYMEMSEHERQLMKKLLKG